MKSRMTKKIASMVYALLVMVYITNAQAPNMFNYQAVARDAAGNVIGNQSIGLRFTVLAGSSSGTPVYQETQTAMTNSLGLFTAAIGGGTVVSGTIAGVNWGGSSEYLKVEIDPTGGTTYTISGTSQLLSVPYALSAGSSSQWGSSGTNIYNLNTGSVGIGIASPVTTLEVSGTGFTALISGNEPWLGLKDTSNTASFFQYDSYIWQGGDLMEMGNVGSYGNGGPIDFYTGSYPLLMDTDGTSTFNPKYDNAPSGFLVNIGDSVLEPFGVSGGFGNANILTSYVDASGAASTDAWAIYSSCTSTQGLAGYFEGNVDISGTMTAGTKAFRIDDPRDPANKYLYHSSIESNDMMNIYNGNITTDANGDATIQLPSYFETVNGDFKYQLTCIGTFAQAIVSEKENNNQFKIKTNQPNVEVSWQISGVRHDPVANYYKIVPEVEKKGIEKGYYQNPEVYGLGKNMSVAGHKEALRVEAAKSRAAKGIGQAKAMSGPAARKAQTPNK